MFSTGGFASSVWWELPNPGGYERRRLQCVRLRVPSIIACNTHLDQHGGETARQQAKFVGDRFSGYARAGYRLVMGGDFNLPPTHEYMNPIYAGGYQHTYGPTTGYGVEVDSSYPYRTGEGTLDGVFGSASWNKIDYIFVRGMKNWTGDVTNSLNSDHNLLWGWADF